MGLDLVEFVMAVEEEFDVPIPAEDWGMLRTVCDLEEYVCRYRVKCDGCLNVPAFVRVRRALIEVCDLPRAAVRVTTSLTDAMPRAVRRSQWKQVCKALEVELPELRIPIMLRTAILGSLAAFVVVSIMAPLALSWTDGLPPALLIWSIAVSCASPFVAWLANRAVDTCLQPFQVEFDFLPPTVGELTRCVARQDVLNRRASIRGEVEPSDQVFERLRSIISRTFNIPTHEIRRDSRFIEDLGLG